MGAVSAWWAHGPVSLLHSGCECDDLWSLRKGLKHAETGCGSKHTLTTNTHLTHTCTFTLITQSQRTSSRGYSRAFIKSQIVMAVGRGHGKIGLPGQLTAMHTGQQSRPLTVVAHQTNSVILMVASTRGHA